MVLLLLFKNLYTSSNTAKEKYVQKHIHIIQMAETWILGLDLGVWTMTLMFSVNLNESVSESPLTGGFQALCGYISGSVCIPIQCTKVP